MADIELVIKIPKEAYKLLQTDGVDWLGAEHILDAVANGTVLEPHGDLKDVSKLESDWCYVEDMRGCHKTCFCNDDCKYRVVKESDIEDLPTIIPATKEGAE